MPSDRTSACLDVMAPPRETTGLSDMQTLRCAADVAFFGHGHEISDLGQAHPIILDPKGIGSRSVGLFPRAQDFDRGSQMRRRHAPRGSRCRRDIGAHRWAAAPWDLDCADRRMGEARHGAPRRHPLAARLSRLSSSRLHQPQRGGVPRNPAGGRAARRRRHRQRGRHDGPRRVSPRYVGDLHDWPRLLRRRAVRPGREGMP